MEQLFDGIYSVASNRLNVCKLALEEMFQYDRKAFCAHIRY